MSGSSVRMCRTTLRTNSAPPKLVVVEAKQDEFAALCRQRGCAFNQAVVIATTQHGLPLLLEAAVALTLRGAGYENEAAADVVFKPRSSGGLAAAIEYMCRLVA